MTRIVSLTPSRVGRDTRTFKEATSFARHGFDSVVVEAAAGARPDGLAFRVHGAEASASAGAAAAPDAKIGRAHV